MCVFFVFFFCVCVSDHFYITYDISNDYFVFFKNSLICSSASLYDKKIVFYILGFRRSISYKPCGFLWPCLPLLLIYECIFFYFVMCN